MIKNFIVNHSKSPTLVLGIKMVSNEKVKLQNHIILIQSGGILQILSIWQVEVFVTW